MKARFTLAVRLLGVCFIIAGVFAAIEFGNHRVFNLPDDQMVDDHMEPTAPPSVWDLSQMLWQAMPALSGTLLCLYSDRIATVAMPDQRTTVSSSHHEAFPFTRLFVVLVVCAAVAHLLDDMGYIPSVFAITWILGSAVGYLIWRFSRGWPRIGQIACASLGAAIFCTPGLVGGHGGIVPLPGVMALAAQPESFNDFAISFGLTWPVCAAICAVIGSRGKPANA